MGKSNKRYHEESITEHDDLDGILFIQECEIFALVDFLVQDVGRLCLLVMEARGQANVFASAMGCRMMDLPYFMTAEDVFDGSFDNHPAMRRYRDLFGGGPL
jgi:hypothetical protein